MPILPVSDSTLRRAAEILRAGGVVAFPTETVYGLGADALAPEACARIFAIKRRPYFDPLIVHVTGRDAAFDLSAARDVRAERLADAFWPGPLTLVLAKNERVPDIVTAGLPTVAVRVPAHPVARALIAASERPIAAPSANPFGYISPTRAEHVAAQIGGEVELILDGGPCEVGVESTIVDLSGAEPVLLRPGGIESERLEAIVGPLVRAQSGAAPRAPGQLPSHYAPRTPLRLLGSAAGRAPSGSKIGLLAFTPPASEVAESFAALEVLAPSGDLREAAARLFAALHRLDGAGVEVIWAEPVPAAGVGVAIVDRLRRAAEPRGDHLAR